MVKGVLVFGPQCIGVLGVAKTMMGDIFSTSMPSIVDTAFAATYVSMISVANMSGRFFWASTSDFVGRKNTFNIFFGLGIPLYMSIPYIADMTNSTDSIAPLILFYGTTMCIFTMYGGGFATVCVLSMICHNNKFLIINTIFLQIKIKQHVLSSLNY